MEPERATPSAQATLVPRAAPSSLEANKLTPLGLTAQNRAAVVTVRSAGYALEPV